MRLTAKRLEDAALSYRGEDRVQLLRRWLVMLRETQRAAAAEKEAKRAGHPDQHLPVLVSIYIYICVSDLALLCVSKLRRVIDRA